MTNHLELIQYLLDKKDPNIMSTELQSEEPRKSFEGLEMYDCYRNMIFTDDDNILDLDAHNKELYEKMRQFSIDKYTPIDFYVDKTKTIRNRFFMDGHLHEFGKHFLCTLDIGYTYIWLFNNDFHPKTGFIQYLDGIWVPDDAIINPMIYGTQICKHMDWFEILEQLRGPGESCGGWKNWKDAPKS